MLLSLASLAFLVLLTSNAAPAQDLAAAAGTNRANKEAPRAENPADIEWYKLTHVSLTQQDPGGSSETNYEVSASGDLRITVSTTEKAKQEAGELMLIIGKRQWMLARNVPLEEGYEIDMLDGPVLDLQLTLELLRAVAPAGPSGILEKFTATIKEGHRPIVVNTASASGGIEAPWALTATIEPVATGRWSFQLSLQVSDPQAETLRLSGTWQKQAAAPAFDDDMLLEGWQILTIGPIRRIVEGGTIYDYGAKTSDARARTLGELRKM
jgi:hypothetical protein